MKFPVEYFGTAEGGGGKDASSSPYAIFVISNISPPPVGNPYYASKYRSCQKAFRIQRMEKGIKTSFKKKYLTFFLHKTSDMLFLRSLHLCFEKAIEHKKYMQ